MDKTIKELHQIYADAVIARAAAKIKLEQAEQKLHMARANYEKAYNAKNEK